MVNVAHYRAPTYGLLVSFEEIVCSVFGLLIEADEVRHGGFSIGHLGRDRRGRDICGKFSVLATSGSGTVGISKTALILEGTNVLVIRATTKQWSLTQNCFVSMG
jgi:hypothetical protein